MEGREGRGVVEKGKRESTQTDQQRGAREQTRAQSAHESDSSRWIEYIRERSDEREKTGYDEETTRDGAPDVESLACLRDVYM